MWECALEAVTVDLCVGKSECWCMCSRNTFWEMWVVVCVRGVSVGVLRECVFLCVLGK